MLTKTYVYITENYGENARVMDEETNSFIFTINGLLLVMMTSFSLKLRRQKTKKTSSKPQLL